MDGSEFEWLTEFKRLAAEAKWAASEFEPLLPSLSGIRCNSLSLSTKKEHWPLQLRVRMASEFQQQLSSLNGTNRTNSPVRIQNYPSSNGQGPSPNGKTATVWPLEFFSEDWPGPVPARASDRARAGSGPGPNHLGWHWFHHRDLSTWVPASARFAPGRKCRLPA